MASAEAYLAATADAFAAMLPVWEATRALAEASYETLSVFASTRASWRACFAVASAVEYFVATDEAFAAMELSWARCLVVASAVAYFVATADAFAVMLMVWEATSAASE